jgi:hypothetical protein
MASSHAVAGDGVKHGAAQKAEANDYEENIEHESLTFRAPALK